MWGRLDEQRKKNLLNGKVHEASEVVLPGRKARDKVKVKIYYRWLQKQGSPRNWIAKAYELMATAGKPTFKKFPVTNGMRSFQCVNTICNVRLLG